MKNNKTTPFPWGHPHSVKVQRLLLEREFNSEARHAPYAVWTSFRYTASKASNNDRQLLPKLILMVRAVLMIRAATTSVISSSITVLVRRICGLATLHVRLITDQKSIDVRVSRGVSACLSNNRPPSPVMVPPENSVSTLRSFYRWKSKATLGTFCHGQNLVYIQLNQLNFKKL